MSQIDRIPQILAAILMIALLLGGEASATEKWGPFRGQVVDLETGQPIPGAVVLVVWWELYGFPFTGERFYEAREAVTDAEGRFEIPRLSLPFWKLGVQAPSFHLFAPGYAWHAQIITPPDGERFVDPTVVQMRRLKTREERIKNLPSRPGVPIEKMPQFIRAMNVESQALGFSPYPIPGETK